MCHVLFWLLICLHHKSLHFIEIVSKCWLLRALWRISGTVLYVIMLKLETLELIWDQQSSFFNGNLNKIHNPGNQNQSPSRFLLYRFFAFLLTVPEFCRRRTRILLCQENKFGSKAFFFSMQRNNFLRAAFLSILGHFSSH